MCGLSCREGYKHCTLGLSKPAGPTNKMNYGERAIFPGELPWMVGLYDPCFDTRKNKPCEKIKSNRKNEKGQVFCGASILNRNWILTAANCIQSESKSNYKTLKARNGNAETTRAIALVGYRNWHETPDRTLKTHKLEYGSLGRDEIPILKFIVHEDYDPTDGVFDVLSVINDIALGLLDRPVNYNNLMDVGGMTLVRPVCIPTVKLENQMLAETKTKGFKKKCFLSGRDTSTTRRKYDYDDVRQGDPGGPLVCPLAKNYLHPSVKKLNENFKNRINLSYDPDNQARIMVQVGIVSFGGQDTPGSYTKVSIFKKWMIKTMMKHSPDGVANSFQLIDGKGQVKAARANRNKIKVVAKMKKKYCFIGRNHRKGGALVRLISGTKCEI